MAKQPSVRELALEILRGAGKRREFINEHLDRVRKVGLTPEEKRFLTTLVYGVTRHRLTLDHLIETLSGVPLKRIQPGVLDLLRMGVYQSLFLSGIPDYAAVDTAVEIAGKTLKGGASRFVNAVMRNLQRARDASDTGDLRRRLPIRPGAAVTFKNPVLPDPSEDPAGLISLQYSHPEWLIERWLKHFGRDRTIRMCEADNHPPRVVLRVNRHQTTVERLMEKLASEGIQTRRADTPDALVAEHTGDLADVPAFREGLFQVQDETTMKVAPVLEPREGGRYLDACAAPGGKTTHLVDLIHDRGLIVAADRDVERLRRVLDHVRRLKSQSVRLLAADGRYLPFRESFDGILVDAPCSNTGVLARRPDARWRIRLKDVSEMSRLQGDLLDACAPLVRPGGALVYSTCSVEPEENEDVIRNFAARHGEFRIAVQQITLPDPDHSGGFVAQARREKR